jgi:hypothetical protein
MPPLRLTRHVRQRCIERDITEEQVIYAVNHKIRRAPSGQFESFYVYGYVPDGRILKVCLATDDPSRVITAMWPHEESQ